VHILAVKSHITYSVAQSKYFFTLRYCIQPTKIVPRTQDTMLNNSERTFIPTHGGAM